MNGHDSDPQPRYDITNENRCDSEMLMYTLHCAVGVACYCCDKSDSAAGTALLYCIE